MADVGWKQCPKILGVIPFDRDVLFFFVFSRGSFVLKDLLVSDVCQK